LSSQIAAIGTLLQTMVLVGVFISYFLLHNFVINLSAPIDSARLSVEPQVPANWTDYLGDLLNSSSSNKDMKTQILAQNLYDVKMKPAASPQVSVCRLNLLLFEGVDLSQVLKRLLFYLKQIQLSIPL
jgi:hypothetical protein